MSTIAREWLALHAFPSLPFADTVMSGKVQARAPHSVWELPPPLLNAMNAAYNGAFFFGFVLSSGFVVRRSSFARRVSTRPRHARGLRFAVAAAACALMTKSLIVDYEHVL
jgi:hypothetical protein